MRRVHLFAVAVVFISLAIGCGPRVVPLDDLLAGIPVDKKERLAVTSVEIGNLSVTDRFSIAQGDPPRGWRYYAGASNQAVLKLKEPRLPSVRTLLLVHDKTLKAHLEDRRDGPIRRVYSAAPWLLPNPFEKVVTIAVDVGPTSLCDDVTVIVYSRVDKILKSELRLEGQTRKEVSLDQVFALLLRDDVEPYINGLDPLRQSECFHRFDLYKWLRNEDVQGFEWREYELHAGLRELLDVIAGTLIDLQLDRNDLQVSMIGYTDASPFLSSEDRARKGRPALSLSRAATGIDAWRGRDEPFPVYYDGCSDNVIDGTAPQTLDLGAVSDHSVDDPLHSNCELGAVRAYVAATYLSSKIPSAGTHYRYGTGGIRVLAAEEETRGRELGGNAPQALQRSVDIRIVLRTAGTGKPQSRSP